MSDTLYDLAEEYIRALRDYLAEGGEAPLQQAYAMGRRALGDGLTALDIALMHQVAMIRLFLPSVTPKDRARTVRRVSDFLAESLSPFDVTQRSYLDRIAQHEKLAIMHQLLALLGRDLNLPLSVVISQTSLLCQAAGEGPLLEQAEKIATAAEQCVRILKDFLALARLRPPERQPMRLDQMVREGVEPMAAALHADGIEVCLDLAHDLRTLWADPHQLQQVVGHLVENAHEGLRETAGPRRLTLTTRSDIRRPWVSLEVADTGPGIPAELQERIFELFFTTKPPGQGTGLGLALCQAIVHGHGGKMQVESTPGHGTTFHIALPVQAPSSGGLQASVSDPHRVLRGKTILVVDDEPGIAGTLVDLLSVDGHQVEVARNGVHALEQLRKQSYDLILSDITMPDLDGLGLYRELERSHRRLCQRFILLIGTAPSPETELFLEQTGVPCLSKPFTLETVRRVVGGMLGAAEA